MVASLLVATAVFGQDASSAKPGAPKELKSCAKPDCGKPKNCAPCPQPCPPTQLCPAQPTACCPAWPVPVLNAAYNYPARTQTRCPWDIFVDASFIYWQPLEENLELGIVGNLRTAGGAASVQLNGNVVDLDYSYKPGFKVGLGGFFDYDNWDLHAEYTWLHSTETRTTSVPAIALPSQVIYPFWGVPQWVSSNVFNSADASWKMHLDVVQLDLGRWYYVGTKLVFHSTLGARGAWIGQHYDITYANTAPMGVGTAEVLTVNAKTHSWAVGPEVGLDAYWNLGEGFRIFGCGEFDILYTRYTSLQLNQYTQATAAAARTQEVAVKQKHLGCLRHHIDLNLGLGWGTYWDCNNWYTDIALGYEFQVFFDQNMFRHFNDDIMFANSRVVGGNLYTQGLTATFSLNF